MHGLNGSRSGLVREVFRLLRKSDVPHILLENVPFMLFLHNGDAIRQVVSSLEHLGYDWAYRVVDSRAFGVPQRRERVFLLASKTLRPWEYLLVDDHPVEWPQSHEGRACGFYWTEGSGGLGWAVDAIPPLKGGSALGLPSPPAIWMTTGEIVTPDIRDAERFQGFPADWTKPAEELRKPGYRWKLVGNAVTVDVAEWIGRKLVLGRPGVIPEHAPVGNGSLPKAAFGGKSICMSRVAASSSPAQRNSLPLMDFLKYLPKPLSRRATEGFHSRLKNSKLRYPQAFERALRLHLEHMSTRVAVR
jgi:DNA (cytosine-5)-methyltransferase 1